MIAILGKGFISCLTSSNNRTPQLFKLSENIYFIGGFIKRVTVKQRLREVVIWGIKEAHALERRTFLAG